MAKAKLAQRLRMAIARVDYAAAIQQGPLGAQVPRAGFMKHYRINKVSKPGGVVLKKKDVLAVSDSDALRKAADSDDCPVCEVLKDGQHVGSVV